MGLFPKEGPCPNCGHQGAMVSWFSTRCKSRGCVSFDPSLLGAGASLPRVVEEAPEPAPERPRVNITGVKDALELAYTNHRGERRVFAVLSRTLRRRGRFVSFKLVEEPHVRISLALERLESRGAVDALLKGPDYPVPQGADKQVLTYHLLRGSSSARFEALKGRYREWIEDFESHPLP